MSQLVPAEGVLASTIECIGEVLGMQSDLITPDTPLSALGLESFTAVRLRRRIRERTDADLPLTTFLDGATAQDVANRLAAEVRQAPAQAQTGRPEEEPAPSGTQADASAGIPPDDGGPFPLTPIQASYFVGRQEGLPLGGVATFYYYEYDRAAEDPLADLGRLEAAWNRLIEHHPMLRMTVDERGRQRILADVGPYRIGTTDLRNASPTDADLALSRLRHERSHQVRPTGTWPLFDIHAALLPDGRTRLHVGVDVLITDLAGWMLLMRQWGRLVTDPAAQLPVPETDFARMQRARTTDPEWAARRTRDRAYWSERAPRLPDAPRLPVLREPEDTTPPRFVRSAAALDAATWAAVRARSAEFGVTPTATLLAAFAALLGRWGAGDRIGLNTTLFDRPETSGEAADAVGAFTTTALVGTPPFTPGRWEGFAGYAAEVNRCFWEDLDHRSVSGVEVLRDHVPVRSSDTAPAPRYPVVFTSGVGLCGDDEPPAAWIGEEVYGISQTPQVLLDHIVWDEGGRLRLAWDWVDGAFPAGYVQALLDAHVRLLSRLAESAAWRDPALGWDPTFRPEEPLDVTPFPDAGPLLHSPVREAAGRYPQRPALHGASGAVTHGRLAENAAATAALLTAHQAGPGDLVAVACEKGVAQITAVLGVSAAGAGYLPIEPTWPDARVAAVCERAGVRHALVGRGVKIAWPPGVTVHRLTATGRPARRAVPEDLVAAKTPSPDDLAYTLFTSGSTGSPKGVEIQHRAARTTIDDIVDRFGIGADDRVLALSALSFDLSVFDIYGVLGAGGSLVLPDPARQRDPQHWLELAGRHGVTVWNTAPALLEMLVEYAELEEEAAAEALRTLRLVMLSGDWIPLTLPERLRGLAPQAEFMSLGGATEASIWSITYPVDRTDPDWRSIPYGRVLRGQSFHVLDEQGAPCPVGEAGELFIGGDGLARGYAGDPVQSAERFAIHPVLGQRLYRTGDLGRWTVEGAIEFLGRADRQVKIRGHRIELGEIEAVLGRHPGVRQCVASSVRGPDGRPRLVAHLSPKGTAQAPSPEDLAAALRERLPEYMIPSRFVVLDQLPVTANGKIDHAALTSPYREQEVLSDGRSATAEPVVAAEPRSAADVPSQETGTGWAAAALDEAAALGLEAAIVLRPGGLPPDQALEATANWLRRVRQLAGPSRLEPRLAAGGLAEIVHRPAAPGTAVAGPVPSPGTAVAGPVPSPGATVSIVPAELVRDATVSVPPAAQHADPVRDQTVLDEVTSVFADLTGSPVQADSTFTALGATSLTLVLAHRRLRQGIAPRLALGDMFAHAGVGSLAARIGELHAQASHTRARAPQPRGGASRTAPSATGDADLVPQTRRASRVAARALARETAG
ncbi:non-ribosomal peptide synthetase [Streptomyces sp. NL15-2K]|uniref:non-ribosomal peptide synthetase n=1 Tax=Streptomyces sp. NL15-2K TaxID=376149 RepID=UPI000F5668E9|nr:MULTISPECIES: non-ribosomal peptide synthetase [Actinomycetes]WKX13660.1 non-ribosomal peptide synthetase [Kutzneria buriramensis]GCB44939.1 iron aquisition yersiniabactin synthesis enzyme [Streptomyces sp. NL15-2K]